MQKNPPAVKRQLRQAQGFVCGFPGCTNPYLSYHHFDPPWRDAPHNNPDGMIGLCGEHHPKADGGSFTKEQLHEYKRHAAADANVVRGQFDWLRKDIAVQSGGILFLRNGIDIAINGQPAVWFNRDECGHALLNVKMPKRDGFRSVIEDQSWVALDDIEDLESPPGGRSLEVHYADGDHLKVAFREGPKFTLVDVIMVVPEVSFSLRTDGISNTKNVNGTIADCGTGVAWNFAV